MKPINPISWPEIHVAFFAFLLHLPWELFQLPLYRISAELSAWETVLHCTRAAWGDVVIALSAFWGTAIATSGRYWIAAPTLPAATIFLTIGLAVTVAFELLATGPWNRWQYSEAMPVDPIWGIGLSPILQWLVLPLLLIVLTRRQLLGQQVSAGAAPPR